MHQENQNIPLISSPVVPDLSVDGGLSLLAPAAVTGALSLGLAAIEGARSLLGFRVLGLLRAPGHRVSDSSLRSRLTTRYSPATAKHTAAARNVIRPSLAYVGWPHG